MRQAYSYIRFSRPSQLKGDSLRRQMKRSRDYCTRHELQLTELPPLKGGSAFKGKHRAEGTALGDFVKEVESGRIPKGSILILESLDRLSREQVRTATKFFISILDLGVDIVTLEPEYVFRAKEGTSDMQDILLAIVILSRAHEESATKGMRLKEQWEKRRNDNTKKMTAQCPAWLKLSADKTQFQVIPEKVKIIQTIFRLAIEGYGVFRIVRKLNQDCIKPIGNKLKKIPKRWYESYIIRILRNRAVLGEMQPCERDENNRSKPKGEVRQGYYPAIISENEFYLAHQAIESRAGNFKRTGKDCPNLFTKLITDARDRTGFIYIPPKKKSPRARLESMGARAGTSLCMSFPYQTVEDNFLRFLTELNSADLFPSANKKEDRVEEISGRLAAIDHKRKAVIAQFIGSEEPSPSVVAVLTELDDQKKMLLAQLETAKGEQASNDSETLGDVKGIIQLLREATDKEELRLRLRQQLRRIIAEMFLLVYEMLVPGTRGRIKKVRCAILQVHFKSGTWRAIDMVAGEEGFNYENKPNGFDIRTYSTMANKLLDKPVPYDEYPSLMAEYNFSFSLPNK